MIRISMNHLHAGWTSTLKTSDTVVWGESNTNEIGVNYIENILNDVYSLPKTFYFCIV